MSAETQRARELLASSEKLLEEVRNRPRADSGEIRRNHYGMPILPSRPELERHSIVGVAVHKRLPNWREMDGGYLEKFAATPLTGRLIHGIASSSTVNSHNYALLAIGMEAELPVPLLSRHEGHRSPIGEVFYTRKSDSRVYVRAALHENDAADYAWDLIQCGDLRCFSGAACGSGKTVLGIVEGRTFYSGWRLREVSICRKGANPDSTFEIWDGVDDGLKFFQPRPDNVSTLRAGKAA